MDYLNINGYGQNPLENTNDALVLTRSRSSGPMSFINKNRYKYDDIRPPPVYLNIKELNFPRMYGLKQIDSDFKVRPTGELKLINEEIREKQKGVITDILKKAATLVLEGKSFVNLSLPIRMFEPRSQIERLCDAFHFFPYYLEMAAKVKDPAERIKLTMTAVFATLHHCLSQYKPFNPMLGETYQGNLGPHTSLSLEHINHHPPISAFYVVNPLFKISGKWTYDAKLGANKFENITRGFMTISFNDGMKIQCALPIAQINGTLVGDRTFRFIHSFLAFEESTCTKGVITFSDGKDGRNFLSNMFSKGRVDRVSGAIYKYDKSIHEKLLAEKWHPMLKATGKLSDMVNSMCTISGSWLEDLHFGDKVYWDIHTDKNKHHQQMAVSNPLPSDCRFREDLIWLYYGNQKYAQEWKLLLEANQRSDREKRNEHLKLNHY